MLKQLLPLALAMTLVLGCDSKKADAPASKTTAEAKPVKKASSQKPDPTPATDPSAGRTPTAARTSVTKGATPEELRKLRANVKKKTILGALAAKAPLNANILNTGGPTTPSNPAALLDPSKATATAPATFIVKFETTKGAFQVQINRHWAPNGADRFYNLVKAGFFTDIAFFRVVNGFMAQFGIHGDPKVAAVWKAARIQDDPVNPQVASNTRGKLTFATAGPNTRSSQFFINYSDRNARLDGMGFSPIGEVIGGLKARIQGMTVVDNLYKGYGEGAPRGKGPAQGRLQSEGNTYLKAEFPEMDYIKSVTIQSESNTTPTPAASAKPAAPETPPAAAAPVDSALLKTATALKDRMCACKDRACIAEVSKDANSLNVGYMKATPAEKTAMRKLGMEMSLCIRKLGPPSGAPGGTTTTAP